MRGKTGVNWGRAVPRKPEPWSVKQRRGYWYYKLSGDTSYRSTGIPVGNWKRTRPIAERYAQEQAGVGPRARQFETFGAYAAPYFLADSCPWFTREHGRGNSVQRHYRDYQRWVKGRNVTDDSDDADIEIDTDGIRHNGELLVSMRKISRMLHGGETPYVVGVRSDAEKRALSRWLNERRKNSR